ncbi:Fe-S cluster biogenesis protein NfuA [Catalinimonas alkaloidigena]|uniref:NifU family protein n=1 Tax=Catalinimonas alkaloidigena TaxID=1075417 RepID=UPI002404AD9E|nr:NifU family protein [Catalinimonas alkaloidigena]MDF9796813.1 Fe-S cluster biogenesis protein NfuA [Catalinimonas alkaloidigena]
MENQEIITRVEKALNDIRPYLETDGGNVRVLGVDENMVVKLELLGACGSCPMSVMTMKAGIEETIKRQVPEVTDVQAVNITSPDDPRAKLPDNMA